MINWNINLLNSWKMGEETEVVENVMFYYYGAKGEKFYTPNGEFATAQANKYGTHEVYVEKV